MCPGGMFPLFILFFRSFRESCSMIKENAFVGVMEIDGFGFIEK
jgi:hypothetical protein